MIENKTHIHTCDNCGSDNVEVEYIEPADHYDAACQQCGRRMTVSKAGRYVYHPGRVQDRQMERSAMVPSNTNIGG